MCALAIAILVSITAFPLLSVSACMRVSLVAALQLPMIRASPVADERRGGFITQMTLVAAHFGRMSELIPPRDNVSIRK
jgi:hypothetical protein